MSRPSTTRHHRRRGLGLIELLTLVALLMIGLAFIVSMARHVRSTSSNELTRKRMGAIANVVSTLAKRNIDPTVPLPAELLADGSREAHEAMMREFATLSSRTFADRAVGGAPAAPALPTLAAPAIGGTALPELTDAWGNPIALMPGQHAQIGMAPDDGPFLVSAGPDGRFMTLADNLYSYDLPALLPRVSIPATNPFAAGD